MDEKKVAPEIDFSPLLQEGERFAVYCKTEDNAKHFLQCLRQAYPRKCRTWDQGETYWGSYAKMCYRPNLNLPDEYTLRYCSLEHYEGEGFTIIPYEDLIARPDIEESESSFDFLLS